MIEPAPIARSASDIGKATLSALTVAILILITVIWPAVYGIDPTSVGRLTGLTGVVAKGADGRDELAAIIAGNVRPAQPGAQKTYTAPFKSEVISIPLASLEEVEFKARMQEGDTLVYSWQSGQPLYVDMHAEPLNYPEEEAVRYEEIDGAQSGHGRLTAAFSGMHGWYWMNTSDAAVVIELKVSGYYDALEEVYRNSQ